MSRRAELSQQLLQLRQRINHHLRALVGTWPGVISLTLVLIALIVGLTVFAQISKQASAQSPATVRLAQIATRVPTRDALSVVTATPPVSPTVTPTVTPNALSPLVAATALTATVIQSQVVPLPTGMTGPEIVPVAVITDVVSGGATDTATGVISSTRDIAATVAFSATPTATPTTDVLILLIPTPTPTPTLAIVAALEQPVVPGGMAGIVATATAAVPAGDAAAQPQVSIAPTAASQPTPDGNVRTVRVPILMYHYLSYPPANADRYRLDLSVTPDLFAAHLDAIQQAGYTTISLYALFDYLMQGTPLPDNPVVLTFDDGYRDNYENAFPLLRDRGLTATFFIVTDFINDQRPEYLTWDMVREMYAAGMSIEGHGRNHVSLANKDDDYLVWQALGTYESIEHEIGVRPRFISYPAGEYDQATIDIFRSANYWAGFTTKQGATHSSDDLFQLRRIRVRGSTSAEELLRLLGLDW